MQVFASRFAPVTARLAAGEPFAAAGTPLDPDELVRLERPRAHRDADGSIVAHAVATDAFGNVLLDLDHGQPAELAELALRPGDEVRISAP